MKYIIILFIFFILFTLSCAKRNNDKFIKNIKDNREALNCIKSHEYGGDKYNPFLSNRDIKLAIKRCINENCN